MQSEWPRCALESVAARRPGAIAIGPFGSRLKTDAYTAHGVALIRGTNVAGSKFLAGEFVYVSEETARGLGNANVEPWDLVFPHRGSIGAVGLVPESRQRYALSTSLMKVTLDRRRVDPLFLYYFFRSSQGQAELLKNASQVGTPGIATPLTSLRACVVPIPPMEEQAAAAQVLSLLDDRIDLLRRTNTTLESIVQALFKSWFIDFDPVRAKAGGREPDGMDAATAVLFPAEFDESTMGLIPRGWAVRSVDDVAQRVGMGPFGSNIKVSTFVESGVPVLTGACLKGTLLEDDELRFISKEHAERLSGSLVGEGDIVITHRGTLGQVSLIPAAATYETYVLSQSQFFVRANPDATTPEFLTYFFRCPTGRHLLLANMSQVGVPSISRPVSYLRSLRLIVPPVSVARAFSSVATALHARIAAGRRQSGMLTELRDSLLPRLITGRIRLPEVQVELEEAIA